MQITTVGLDLAKNVFQVHGVNEHGKVVLRKQLRPPCANMTCATSL
jgi:transposase